jgi:glycosyltransferase involved in cell wall biosynthesis
MNILFYCPFNFSVNSKNINELGGIETLNIDLSKRLSNLRHKIYLASYCKRKTKSKNLINLPINDLLIKKYNFDVIISSNDATIFNNFEKSKKILWLHNTLAIEKAIRKRFLFSILFNKINAIFVSSYLNKITSRLYLFNKRQILPNFLPSFFEKNKRNFKRDKIFVWSVQRDKGLQETLDIWSEKIYTKKKNVKLYIFGIKKSLFKNRINYYQKKNIFFFGRVSKLKLKSIYNKSLAMICLGYDETFCLNALEANSCGLPIITFGNTALKDFTLNNKNGFLVNNFDEMVKKILDLSISKTDKSIINYCYNNSKKYYLDKSISKWHNLIKS